MNRTLGALLIVVVALLMAFSQKGHATSENETIDKSQKTAQPTEADKPHPKMPSQGHPKMGNMQRLKTHFHYIDKNNDGKISNDEYIAPYQKRFLQLDHDGDGYLSQEEFGRGWANMRKKGTGKPHGK